MNVALVIGLVILAVIMMLVSPLFSMMAINSLFGTTIAYTLGNWFAMFWIHLVLFGTAYRKAQ